MCVLNFSATFVWNVFHSKATATLEPEPTQHNSLDRLQIRKWKSKTLLFMLAATPKPIRLECYFPRISGVSV